MKAITAKEFAHLCRSDPDIHDQMLAIPKTVTAEKIFSLAERNGYRILPEQPAAKQAQIELLRDDELDRSVERRLRPVRHEAVQQFLSGRL